MALCAAHNNAEVLAKIKQFDGRGKKKKQTKLWSQTITHTRRELQEQHKISSTNTYMQSTHRSELSEYRMKKEEEENKTASERDG